MNHSNGITRTISYFPFDAVECVGLTSTDSFEFVSRLLNDLDIQYDSNVIKMKPATVFHAKTSNVFDRNLDLRMILFYSRIAKAHNEP